jgi:hypothetical protein
MREAVQKTITLVTSEQDQAVLGLNVFAAIMDEANFAPPTMPAGTPIRHRDHPDVVGVVASAYFDRSKLWYVIDWLVEGFAPQVKATWVRELPSEMHLLASV